MSRKDTISSREAALKMTKHTKIDITHSRIARMEGLDELAKVLFPGNPNHQRTFHAIFVELKWAEHQFLPALDPVAAKHGISPRTLETVRAKMRRLGTIDHVSRFNKRHGYREGWVFSKRFERSLERLANLTKHIRENTHPDQHQKDRDAAHYL